MESMWSSLPLCGVKKIFIREQAIFTTNSPWYSRHSANCFSPSHPKNQQTKPSLKECKWEEVTWERAEKLTRCQLEEAQEDDNVRSNLRWSQKSGGKFVFKMKSLQMVKPGD